MSYSCEICEVSVPFNSTSIYQNKRSTIKNWWKQVVAYRSTTNGDLKPLSGISKSQTWEFVFNKFKIEESVELKLHMVVLVSSIRGNFRFRV